MPGPLDIYEASLETARFRDGPQDAPFVNYLLALFGGKQQPDLVVAVGGPAVLFAERYRPQLHSTPLLVTGLDERRLQGVPLTPNDAVVAIRQDLPDAVENILRLLPKTSTIMVVLGNSPLEKFWLSRRQAGIRAFHQAGELHLDQRPPVRSDPETRSSPAAQFGHPLRPHGRRRSGRPA